jgi:hypothetical protein
VSQFGTKNTTFKAKREHGTIELEHSKSWPPITSPSQSLNRPTSFPFPPELIIPSKFQLIDIAWDL